MCQQAGFSPGIVQEAATQQTIVALVSMGIGVTFLPDSLKLLGQAGVIYRPAIEPTPEIEIAIAWRASDTQTVLHSFIEVVRAVCSRDDAKSTGLNLKSVSSSVKMC